MSATYEHVLLAVVDSKPYLSRDTRVACAVAAAHACAAEGKLTVLIADTKPLEAGSDANVRMDTVRFHINESGFAAEQVTFLTETGEKPAVAISDAADSVAASLVVMSAAAVHSKAVDCNLLAEFLSAPLLLVP